MRFAGFVAVSAPLVFALGCGGGGMGSSGAGGGGGTNPPQESVVISRNTNPQSFNLAMSTSFQPAEWDAQFFTLNPSASTTLGNLEPHHIRLQGISQGVPQGAAGSTSTAWDFSTLDAITQPVLGVGDHSPEFQIAKAPPFMYSGNDSGSSFLDPSFFAVFRIHAESGAVLQHRRVHREQPDVCFSSISGGQSDVVGDLQRAQHQQ